MTSLKHTIFFFKQNDTLYSLQVDSFSLRTAQSKGGTLSENCIASAILYDIKPPTGPPSVLGGPEQNTGLKSINMCVGHCVF